MGHFELKRYKNNRKIQSKNHKETYVLTLFFFRSSSQKDLASLAMLNLWISIKNWYDIPTTTNIFFCTSVLFKEAHCAMVNSDFLRDMPESIKW